MGILLKRCLYLGLFLALARGLALAQDDSGSKPAPSVNSDGSSTGGPVSQGEDSYPKYIPKDKRWEHKQRRGRRMEKQGEAVQERGEVLIDKGDASGNEKMERRGKHMKKKGQRREARGEHKEKKGKRMSHRAKAAAPPPAE